MLLQIRAPEIEKARFIFSVLARLFQTEIIQGTFKSFLIISVFCPYNYIFCSALNDTHLCSIF